MNKQLATVGLATALAGTSILGIGIAGAQTDDTAPSDPTPSDTTPSDTGPSDRAPGFRDGRHAHRGAGIQEAAALLDMEPRDLLAALRDGATLAELAEAEGVSVDDLIAAMLTRPQERLAEAVEDGVLTQEEADAHLARITEQVTAIVNGEIEPIGGPRDSMAGVAELLGLEPSEVVEALRGGQTLADLAGDAGVSVEDLVDALLANHAERLDRAVENGRLTADEAAERLAEIEDHVTDVVNGDAEPRGPRGDGGRRGPGGPGGRTSGAGPFGGGAPADVETVFAA
ncbi:MAG TPA: hypothetical protein VK866_14415 [Acidimicrobiales bacterium]|nr:hypothetical protein [Acidimicrobiales bacterium]